MAIRLSFALSLSLTASTFAFHTSLMSGQETARFRRGRMFALKMSGSVEKNFASAAAALLPKNVLGGTMQCCCAEPRTGFYRDGFCTTGNLSRIYWWF